MLYYYFSAVAEVYFRKSSNCNNFTYEIPWKIIMGNFSNLFSINAYRGQDIYVNLSYAFHVLDFLYFFKDMQICFVSFHF